MTTQIEGVEVISMPRTCVAIWRGRLPRSDSGVESPRVVAIKATPERTRCGVYQVERPVADGVLPVRTFLNITASRGGHRATDDRASVASPD